MKIIKQSKNYSLMIKLNVMLEKLCIVDYEKL